MEDIIFVIIRHVRNENTDKLWKETYKQVRLFHPDIKILIVDDNSSYKPTGEDDLENTVIVQSEFPARGELLGIYYFWKLNIAKKAIIIHDSVFINKAIDVSTVENYKFIWSVVSGMCIECVNDDIIRITKCLDHSDELIKFYNNLDNWNLCFGIMCVITHEFIDRINTYFNFFPTMLEHITCKHYRTCLERIFGFICAFTHSRILNGSPDYLHTNSIYGNVHSYQHVINTFTSTTLNWKPNNYFPNYDEFEYIKEHIHQFPIFKITMRR